MLEKLGLHRVERSDGTEAHQQATSTRSSLGSRQAPARGTRGIRPLPPTFLCFADYCLYKVCASSWPMSWVPAHRRPCSAFRKALQG